MTGLSIDREIPGVENLTPFPTAPRAPYVVSHNGADRRSQFYHGQWRLDSKDKNSTTVSVIIEVIPLGGNHWETPGNPKKRADVLKDLSTRVAILASRLMPFVVPVIAAGEMDGGDFYVVRPETDALALQDTAGMDIKDFRRCVEGLLNGLAALHDAGVAFGDLRLEDLRTKDGQYLLSGAEFGALHAITGGYFERQPSIDVGEPQEAGARMSNDIRRLGRLICQLAGGRDSNTPSKVEDAGLRAVVQRCVSDDDSQRPADARAALRVLAEFRNKWWRATPRWLMPVAVVVAILAGVVGYQLNDTSQQLEETNARIAGLQSDKEDLEEQLANARRRSPANDTPSDTQMPSSITDAEASKWFDQYYGGGESQVMNIDEWLEQELDKSHKKTDKALAEAKKRISSYQYALQEGEYYTLKLTSTNVDPDWLITVYVEGETPREGDGKSEVKFRWKPNRAIQLLVEDGTRWYKLWSHRSNLIDKTYGGTYALWQLHRDLYSLTQGPTTISGKITNFPRNGPSRELLKPKPKSAPRASPPAASKSGGTSK